MKENFLLLPLVELSLIKYSNQRSNIADNQIKKLLNFRPGFVTNLKCTVVREEIN